MVEFSSQNDDIIEVYSMSAPWKSDQTTLEKIEGTVMDFLDGLEIEDRVNDWKDQIASSDAVDTLREKVPGVTPAKKSHKMRNLLLVVLLGAGAAAFIASRNKPQPPPVPPQYAPAN